MHFQTRKFCFVTWSILIAASACTAQAAPPLAFNYEYIFTAHLNLGAPSKPIPVPGGVRIVEPIINGTVTGPAINATLGYSLATPAVINNQTTQVPVINAVGTTDDGQPLYIYEEGIGSPSLQITRIKIEVAGSKYARLHNGFILAAIEASADRTSVMVTGYLINNAGT